MDALRIGSDRQCFVDDYLLDVEKTTAPFRLHQPARKEVVLVHDASWEGDNCIYHHVFKDGDIYRMYYMGNGLITKEGKFDGRGRRVCYAESRDGLHWEKPNLGLHQWEGSWDNNILLGEETARFDNFMVFRDDNPDCPPDKRYKGIAPFYSKGPTPVEGNGLWCFNSPDGIYFTLGDLITTEGYFDTLNVCFWDPREKMYRLYFRGFHKIPGGDLNSGIRDVRYIESTDFEHWSKPVMIGLGDARDYPLYTNNVMMYNRAPGLYIGYPTRYVERHQWDGSFEELCGKEKRKWLMGLHPRYGLAITDSAFMCSHDGKNFKLYDEPFMTPGPENPDNWVYGDCYPALGWLETPSDIRGEETELSTYMRMGGWTAKPVQLYRYTIRKDGFVSLHADGKTEIVETKPLIYEGTKLRINFATSARGFVRAALRSAEGEEYISCETFGNTTDRLVAFDDPGAVAKLAGKPVTLRLELCEADLYALRFAE